MRVIARSGLEELADHLRAHAYATVRAMPRVVKSNLRQGNDLAKGSAGRTARKHGRHYSKAFGYELHGITSSLTGSHQVSGEYGPDPSMPQGGMSFEGGSRNQKPHGDLARSADIQAPQFAQDVARLGDGLLE